MRRRRNASILLFVATAAPLLAGCTDSKPEPPAANGESSGSETSSGSGGSNTTFIPIPTTGEGTGESESESSTGASFIVRPDNGGVAVQCDVWTDDCPDGQKCMPWANDGGSVWNATRCSELASDPKQIGDECSVEGNGTSGIDDCGARSMCYYVDNETNLGTCIAFCDGSPATPTCAAGSICTIVNDGVLTLCRPECDPILQDCEGRAVCAEANGTNGFTCIVDASGEEGQAGDPCGFINSCDPGLLCANAAGVPGCTANACCTEFCDVTDPEPDAFCSLGEGSVCVPWFAEGEAPPDYAHVGQCVIPQ